MGFIDTTGKFAIEPRYSYSLVALISAIFGWIGKCGRKIYRLPYSETWIYVDKQGNQVLGPINLQLPLPTVLRLLCR